MEYSFCLLCSFIKAGPKENIKAGFNKRRQRSKCLETESGSPQSRSLSHLILCPPTADITKKKEEAVGGQRMRWDRLSFTLVITGFTLIST